MKIKMIAFTGIKTIETSETVKEDEVKVQ